MHCIKKIEELFYKLFRNEFKKKKEKLFFRQVKELGLNKPLDLVGSQS